jgi:plastocyanin
MKKSTFNLRYIVLASVLSAALLYAVVSIQIGYHTQIADAKKSHHPKGSSSGSSSGSSTKDTTPDNTPNSAAAASQTQQQQPQPSIPGALQLSAKEASGGYRWINATSGAINHTMNFAVNTNKTIQIQNPTDAKHQLIIDMNGKQLTSGDIASSSSGMLSFKPGVTGIFQYHCLYHPTTMKGVIQVG